MSGRAIGAPSRVLRQNACEVGLRAIYIYIYVGVSVMLVQNHDSSLVVVMRERTASQVDRASDSKRSRLVLVTVPLMSPRSQVSINVPLAQLLRILSCYVLSLLMLLVVQMGPHVECGRMKTLLRAWKAFGYLNARRRTSFRKTPTFAAPRR